MNIKNTLLTIIITSFIINNIHANRAHSVKIIYNTETNQYELIKKFWVERTSHSISYNLSKNTPILIHLINNENNNIKVTSAEEFAQQHTAPLKFFGNITPCSSHKSNQLKEFYVLESLLGRPKEIKTYDSEEEYCNYYENFINEYVAKQQTK